MTYDISRIHGSQVLNEGLRFLDSGVSLQDLDIILFPCLYRIISKGQSRLDLFQAMQEIQSYTCCKDYR